VSGLADMYYSSPNTLVPIYETTRHIQKEDSNPGADYLLSFGNKFDGCHPVFSITTSKHFNFSV
jgi:hypothetical protein